MKKGVALIPGLGRVLAGLALLCGVASADTISVLGTDTSRGADVWIREHGVDTQVYAGVINIRVTSGTHNYLRDTLCVDLFTNISIQTYGVRVDFPSDVPGKNLLWVSWLIDNALLPAENHNYTSQLPQNEWVTTAAQGAGLQLAIWDIVHDGGDGFTSGSVMQGSSAHPTTASILQWANTYENELRNRNYPTSNLAYIYDPWVLPNGAHVQMLAGPMFLDGGPQPTPEPSTFVLMGFALVGFSWRNRRSRLFRRKPTDRKSGPTNPR